MSEETENVVRVEPSSVSVPLKSSERDALLIDMHSRLAYVQAKIEILPDHEDRIRKVEKRVWGVPGSLIAALAALFFGVHPN